MSDANGTQTESVVAPAPGSTACTTDTTGLLVGSISTVTEVEQPNVAVSAVTIMADSGTVSGASATLTVSDTGVRRHCSPKRGPRLGRGLQEPGRRVDEYPGLPLHHQRWGWQSLGLLLHGGGLELLAGGPGVGEATVNEIRANPNFHVVNVSTVSPPIHPAACCRPAPTVTRQPSRFPAAESATRSLGLSRTSVRRGAVQDPHGADLV